MRDDAAKHDAMAEAIRARVDELGYEWDSLLHTYIFFAKQGRYAESPPVDTVRIGFTRNEFQALRAIIYG